MKSRLFGHYVSTPMLVLLGCELVLLVFVFYTGYYIRWQTIDPSNTWVQENWNEALGFSMVFEIAMVSLGLYTRSISNDLRETFVRLISVCVVGFIALTVLIFTTQHLHIWRSTLAFVIPLTVAAIMTTRFIALHVLDLGALKRPVLVLGSGKLAARIADLERSRMVPGLTLLGFVRMNETPPEVDPARVVDRPSSIVAFAKKLGIEEIIIAMEERRGALPVQELLACRSADIRVCEYATFWEREQGEVLLDAFNPSWMLFSDYFVGGWFQSTTKRMFDIGASLLLLVFTAPAMALTALAIKLTSPGPVLYRQERTGFLGQPFMLLKFRSLRVDAESDGKPRWAQTDDPRVTRLGAFIRKTRIDELPQIFNVLRGDMSFIGPRPERPFFVEQLSREIPYYGERHRVKPGISGWAQVRYAYGASTEDARRKLQFDLYYVKNYSLFLDMLIFLLTVRVVLMRVGSR